MTESEKMNKGRGKAEIEFVRLRQIAPNKILSHMSDPRVAAHLPLLKGGFDGEMLAQFLRIKDACWTRDGLGHWGILNFGDYVGWGGFEKQGPMWDFGLVLRVQDFGLGMVITRHALEFARSDPRIKRVSFLLAPTRRHFGALERLGATPAGEVVHAGERFRKFVLNTE